MLELRSYQKDIILNCRHSFLTGHLRPMVVLPCGGGKTCIFSFMAGNAQSKGLYVLIIVHRSELYYQTVETFKKMGIPLNTIRVVMAVTYANHIGQEKKPDLIITDEGHLSAANTWLKIYNHFPSVKVISFTATPCRLDGKPLGEIYDDLIIGISTHELIQRGYLAHYRYFAPPVADLSGLKRKGADFDSTQAEGMLMQRAVYGDVIKSYRERADGLQTICYCTTIKHSQTMANEFNAAGITARHFDGNTPKAERERIVADFRAGNITVLCNVDLISVGFDVPDCWCCILLRPTMSTALFIQQACRALRPQPGKTAIILDHVGNYARHGLPDDDRIWSLTDKLPPHDEYQASGNLTIRQCQECYFTYPGTLDICPQCGAPYVSTREEIRRVKKTHLEEIKQEHRVRAMQSAQDKTLEECRSLSEIMAWCKLNGKKAGYGYYEAKRRGLIHGKRA